MRSWAILALAAALAGRCAPAWADTPPGSPGLQAQLLGYGGVGLTVGPVAQGTNAVSYISVSAQTSQTSPIWVATVLGTGAAAETLTAQLDPSLCGWVTLTAEAVDVNNETGTASVSMDEPCGPVVSHESGPIYAGGSFESLAWGQVADAVHYVVAAGTSSPGTAADPVSLALTVTAETSFDYPLPADATGVNLFYRVYTVNQEGVTSTAEADSGDTAYSFAVPQIAGFTASDGVTFTASWSPFIPVGPSADVNYSLYGSATDAPSSFTLLTTVAATLGSVSLPVPAQGGDQWYFLSASDSTVSSSLTPSTASMLFAPPLPAPAVSASTGAVFVDLAWNPVPNASGYQVFRADVSPPVELTTGSGVPANGLNPLSFSDTTSFLAGGSAPSVDALSYAVQAYTNLTPPGAVDESAFSTVGVGNPGAAAAPGTFTAQATGQRGTVALAWSPIASSPTNGVSAYVIYYSTQSASPFGAGVTSTSVPATQTAATITAFPSGIPLSDDVLTWFWLGGSISSVNVTSSVGALSPGVGVIPYVAPQAPTLSAGVLPYGQGVSVSVAVTGNPDVALGAVTVYETLQSVSSPVATLNPPGPPVGYLASVTLTAGLFPCGVPVTLDAQTVDIAGDTGTPSNHVWLQEPCAPTVTASALNSGVLILTWPSPNAGSGDVYDVFSATGAGWAENPLPTAVSSSANSGIGVSQTVAGQSNWYRVYAVDPRGVTSPASNEVGLLAPPSQVQAAPSAGSTALTWTAPPANADTGLKDYEIYYSSAPGFLAGDSVLGLSPGASSLTAAASSLGATVPGLANAQAYAFAVASVGGSGALVSGTASQAVSVTTGLDGPSLTSVATTPTADASVNFQSVPASASPLFSTLLLQWNLGQYSPLTSTVYTVYRATDAISTPQTFSTIMPITETGAAATGVTVTVPAPGPAWYFINVSDSSASEDGGDSTNARSMAAAFFAPSLSATALSLLTPTADGRILLQWNPVPFADSYAVYRATQDIPTENAQGLTVSALSTTFTPSLFESLGQVPEPLTYTTGTFLTFVDASPVENSHSSYEVVPLAHVAGNGLIVGPASNAVTRTSRVLPQDPGFWQMPGFQDVPGSSDFYVTVAAQSAANGGIFLEWTPSDAGTFPISYYTVYRGFSAQSLSLTVLATVPATAPGSAMPSYVDLTPTPPSPWSDLVYGVSATDIKGVGSPDIVTGTVGGAQTWPAPILGVAYYSNKQVTLSWTPATGTAGTFPFKYWQVESVAAVGGTATVLAGAGPPYLVTVATTSNLTRLSPTTVSDLSPAPGTPLYLISAVDQQGNAGVPLGVSVTVPVAGTNTVPLPVTGLTAAAAVTVSNTATVLAELLSWTPNAASDGVSAYNVFRMDPTVSSPALVATVASPPYLDALTVTTNVPASAVDVAGVSVTYTVSAVNNRGVGPASTPLELVLEPPAPAWISPTVDIPAGVAASPAIGLTWQDALQIQGAVPPYGQGAYNPSYEVFRSDNLSTPLPDCAGITTTTCADLSPTATPRTYRVQSVLADLNIPGSGISQATALSYPLAVSTNPPAPLLDVGARSGSSGVSLTWSASTTPGTLEYWVYRSSFALGSAPPYSAFLARVTGTAFLDTGLLQTIGAAGLSPPAQTDPYYAVAAANPFQVGPALTVTAALSPPTLLSAQAGSVGTAPDISPTVSLAWTASASGALVTGYEVWRASGGAQGLAASVFLGTTSGTTYTDVLVGTGLTNTALSYVVMAQGASVGACSTPVTVTAYDLPRVPVALFGQGFPTGVDFSWRPAPNAQGVTGYAIAWTVLNGNNSGAVQLPASPQTWTLGGLVPGQMVAVTVTALNSAGASLGATASATANSVGPAEIPAAFTLYSGLAATATGQCAIGLNFSALNATSLVVYRKAVSAATGGPLRLTQAAGGPLSPFYLETLDGAATALTDTALTPLTRYSYAITAVNAEGIPGGESLAMAGSPTVQVAFSTWAAPALTATAGNARIDLQWTPPALAQAGSYALAGYRLYRQQGSPEGVAYAGTTATSDPGFPMFFPLTQTVYTDFKVANGLPYSYSMTSVDANGNESTAPAMPQYPPLFEGIAATGFTPTGPVSPPTNLVLIPGNDSVVLNWVTLQSDASSGGLYNVYRRLTGTGSTYGPPLPNLFHVASNVSSYPTGVSLLVESLTDGADLPDSPPDKVTECYALTVVDGSGEGPKSPDLCTTPFNPLSGTAAVGGGNWTLTQNVTNNVVFVTLTWPLLPAVGNSAPGNGVGATGGYAVLGYNIYRSQNAGISYEALTFVAEAGATNVTYINGPYGPSANYVDSNVQKGQSYYYRIVPVDTGGNEGSPYFLKFVDVPSGQNSLYVFRNSFDPITGGFVPIQCGLQQSGRYTVKIYTLNGEYVDTVIPSTNYSDNLSTGSALVPYLSPQVNWNGTNARGQTVASGVYLIHLEGPGYKADARVAVIK